jgi:hypothetical protein
MKFSIAWQVPLTMENPKIVAIVTDLTNSSEAYSGLVPTLFC